MRQHPRVQVSDSALKKGNGSICYRFSFYNSVVARTQPPEVLLFSFFFPYSPLFYCYFSNNNIYL